MARHILTTASNSHLSGGGGKSRKNQNLFLPSNQIWPWLDDWTPLVVLTSSFLLSSESLSKVQTIVAGQRVKCLC